MKKEKQRKSGYAELLIKELKLNEAKHVGSPGNDEQRLEMEENERELDGKEGTEYMGNGGSRELFGE